MRAAGRRITLWRFPEVIDEGRTGLLVPPRDPAALAAAVRSLIDDPERRRAMADAAPGWAAQFAWSAVADRVEAAYHAAVRGTHVNRASTIQS